MVFRDNKRSSRCLKWPTLLLIWNAIKINALAQDWRTNGVTITAPKEQSSTFTHQRLSFPDKHHSKEMPVGSGLISGAWQTDWFKHDCTCNNSLWFLDRLKQQDFHKKIIHSPIEFQFTICQNNDYLAWDELRD